MFHKNGTAPDRSMPERNKVPEPEQPQPQAQQPLAREPFPYQTKVVEQAAFERYTRNETVQASVKNPPANQSATQTAVQSQPLTEQPFYGYEQTIPEEKDTGTMTPEIDNKNESKTDAPASRIDIPGGVFARPGQQPPIAGRVPGAYPGAYPGAATGGYGQPSPAAMSDAASGRKLYIGPGITLSGEIESCDHLVVEGTVEAALKGASVLEIAEPGAYYGTVDIDEAMIAGRFEGDLTVRGRLTIKATGSITGAVAYKELAVEAGATLDGKVSPLDAKAAGANRKVTNTKAKTTDFGAELPFEGKAVAAE